jgi:hypothetical protein
MPYIGKSPTGTGVRSRYYYTATGGETSLSGADDNSNTLVFSDGNYVDVSLNGIALVAGTDYNTSTANTIAGLSALSTSDIVEIVVYDIFTVADTVSAKDGGTFSGAITANSGLNVGTIKEATGTNTAISIDSTGFASGLMVNAGRQSLASSNGYTWTGIPSTAKRIIVVYRLFYTQSSDANKTTVLRVGDGSIVTSGYEEVSIYQDGAADGTNKDGTGFHTFYWDTGTQNQFGKYELTYLHGNGWVINGLYTITEAAGVAHAISGVHSGYIGLTSALDRVQLKIKDGTTTYNANSEAVLYYMG